MKRVSTESVKALSGKKAYVGIDVHKESWHVTIRADGEEVFNGRIPVSYHSLIKLLERFEDYQVKVGYENVGFFYRIFKKRFGCTTSLYRKKTSQGIEAL